MREVNPRPFLVTSVLYFALAVVLGVAEAVLDESLLHVAFFSAVVFGFLLPLVTGLLAFYLPTFVKREAALPVLAYASLAAVHAGFLVLATAPSWAGAVNLHLALEGAALLLFVVHGGTTAALGRRRVTQKPLHRSGGPHADGDALTVGTFTVGFLYLAIAGAYLLSPRLRLHFPVEAILVAVLAGAFVQFAYAAAFHLAPRSFKQPLVQPEVARWGVIVHNFGILGVLPAMVGEQDLAALWMFAPLPLVGLALVTYTLARTRLLGKPLEGGITRAAAPYHLAAFPLGILAAVLFSASPWFPGLLVPALLLVTAGVAVAYAGYFVQLVPVIANAVPGDVGLAYSSAFLALAAGLLAAGVSVGFAPAWIAAIPGAVAAFVFLAHAAPLRKPRRDCLPSSARRLRQA